jgi:hypothetical protein
MVLLTKRMLSFLKTPPRIPELLFAAVLIWLFAAGQGWQVLLADGDTGWHIRNGERIIDTRTVPHSDPFSFGSGGHPWFAWEWLSDVLFAALFRRGGLKAVTVLCGIVIAASVSVLLRHMLWRSVGICLALPLALLAAGASSVHYLARPHVIGLLLFAVVAWIVDRDRASPARFTWSLPLFFLLWANCHGSFLAGLGMLGLRLFETALRPATLRRRNWSRRERRTFWRAAMLLGASGAATLLNPYGWRLHAHAIEYLRSAWIQSAIEEFQSPRFRSENMLQYEFLLLAGVSALPWLLRRKQFYPCCVILLWAHESLASVRHVPLYCLAACPFTGVWLQANWNRWLRGCRPGSLWRALDAINFAWHPWYSGYTIWPWLLAISLGATAAREAGSQVSFPASKFPVNLVERNSCRLASLAGSPRRVFSSDQWSDYLIFRLYPRARVFFDGRSDFFGPWRGKSYQELMQGESDSPAILDRADVELALVPKDWALAGLLRRCPQWRVADADGQAVLFERDFPKDAFAPNQKERDGR